MEYYIQNKDRGYLGNAIFFWKKGCNGYTVDLNQSEIFTEEEAAEICKGDPSKNKAWPVEYINSNKGIQKIIDSQYIDEKNIKKF